MWSGLVMRFASIERWRTADLGVGRNETPGFRFGYIHEAEHRGLAHDARDEDLDASAD
jgi:hypothetical protein